jgi:N-acetyl sugar amidotransferase
MYDEEKLKQDSAANYGRPYQQCAMSVMDTIADPNITFDEKGISNYYSAYKVAEKAEVLTGDVAKRKVEQDIELIKQAGKGKDYDCVLGVSGGVDSTYLALLAKKMGLRPLLLHFDNGWNSELAVKNVENIVTRLGFDLYTYVVDWSEFKDVQLAYFKANVIDLEAVTDLAIFSILDQITAKHKIPYVLDGRNVVTEQVLPSAWIFKDTQNLRAIHKRFGSIPLKTYPIMSPLQNYYAKNFHKLQNVQLLNYVPYNKTEVKKIIIDELGWRDYGGKHYESIFTRFYQGYILPNKFNVDKRKAHLSNLIFSGQITKEQALSELKDLNYDPSVLAEDKAFVMKKLDFTEESFEEYMNAPQIRHKDYGYTLPIFEQYPLLKLLRPLNELIKKIKS